MRTIVDLPESQINALKELGEATNQSRAELVRQAVQAFIDKQKPNQPNDAFGILNDSPIKDAVAFQKTLRDEWDK